MRFGVKTTLCTILLFPLIALWIHNIRMVFQGTPKIVLIMVVYNEYDNLKSNLMEWHPFVDHFVIGVDSRTTDDSITLLNELLGQQDLSYILHNVTFDGFGPTLTELINLAHETYPEATVGLTADADMRPLKHTFPEKSFRTFDKRCSYFNMTVWSENTTVARTIDWGFRLIPGAKAVRRVHHYITVRSFQCNHTYP